MPSESARGGFAGMPSPRARSRRRRTSAAAVPGCRPPAASLRPTRFPAAPCRHWIYRRSFRALPRTRTSGTIRRSPSRARRVSSPRRISAPSSRPARGPRVPWRWLRRLRCRRCAPIGRRCSRRRTCSARRLPGHRPWSCGRSSLRYAVCARCPRSIGSPDSSRASEPLRRPTRRSTRRSGLAGREGSSH